MAKAQRQGLVLGLWALALALARRTNVRNYGWTKYPLHSMGHRPSVAAAQKACAYKKNVY